MKIYKKEKDIFFKDLLIFLSEYYFQSHLKNNFVNSTNLLDKRLNILENIDNFFVYNLNQNSLLNSIEKIFMVRIFILQHLSIIPLVSHIWDMLIPVF